MNKLLVISGSSSRESINLKLANHAASLVAETEVKRLDLNEFEMPIYSVDREAELGIPQEAQNFVAEIESADGIVLSLAEHNGSYTAAFKNLLDWASRAKQKLWSEKPMLLLATSPGGRGAATVLAAAEGYFPHMGAKIVAGFSLPSFYESFEEASGVKTDEVVQFKAAVETFQASLEHK